MVKARKQAEGYAKALPEWPPFLIVTDVGHCVDLYADFSGTGKLYQPFPDPKSYRIPLSKLADDDIRETLSTISGSGHWSSGAAPTIEGEPPVRPCAPQILTSSSW